MTYPTVPVSTVNMDAGTDRPADARSNFLDLATKFNALIPLPADLAAPTGAGLVGSAAWYALTIIGFDATKLPDGATVVFSGRSGANDGGGGTFTYAKSGMQASDNGLVFTPIGGGRLLRNGWTVFGFNGALSVKYFGAIGNAYYLSGSSWFADSGFTIPAADDTTAIQATVAAAFANRQEVVISGGRFLCGQILLPQNTSEPVLAFRIRGNGGTIVISGTSHLFSVSGTFFYDLFVNDINFEGVPSGAYASVDSKIFDCGKIMRLNVARCTSRYVNTFFDAPATKYMQSVFAHQCIYRGGGSTGYFCRAEVAFDVSLIDCLVEQSYNGLRVVAPGGSGNLQQVSRVLVMGGAWESLAGTAISVGPVFQFTVDSVYFEGNANYINLSSNPTEAPHLGLTIVNNDFYLSPAQIANTSYYPITWGNNAAFQHSYRTGGNKSNGNLHDISGAFGSFDFTGDYAGLNLYPGMNTSATRVGNAPVGRVTFSDPEGTWHCQDDSMFVALPGAGGYETGKIGNADLVSGKIVRPKFLVGSLNPATNPATYGSTEWCRGSFVTNTVSPELGTAGSKYLVLGWKCITSGVGGNAGTDRWLDCRVLTGN